MPRARVAAIIKFSVPVTETFSKFISAPIRRPSFGARATTSPDSNMTSAPNFSNPARCKSIGRAHCLYQFIRRVEQLDVRGGNLVSPKLRSQHMRADVVQQTPLGDDVAYV